jgi:hypothetical protein
LYPNHESDQNSNGAIYFVVSSKMGDIIGKPIGDGKDKYGSQK